TELGPPDDSGRRRPVPVEGSEFIIPCDAVIPAIGQKIDTSWAAQIPDLKWTLRNTLGVNLQTMQTSIPYVFAGGDAVTGPDTVIQAVAEGHKAVEAIHRYINGENLELYIQQIESRKKPGTDWQKIPEGIPKKARSHPKHLESKMSAACFEEVDLGLTEGEARQEALRCLNCGVCSECMECVKACEPKAIDHNMQAEELEVKIGSIIVATGYDVMDPAPMKQFGYGKYPNVFTSLEFERLSNATGPTGGEIFIRDESGDFTRTPKSVAILHCIGSRDVNYHEYCSRVCCMYALKYAHLIHEKVGHDTQVYNFYIDMRCFGKGYEEFYKRCQEEGTRFIRGKVAEVTDQSVSPEEEGKLIAVAEDTLLGRRLRIPVDMVILCVAMQARSDAQEVGRVFGVNQGADGFFLEEHPKLGPLNTATDGVFIAGACQGPKDIPDTVSQASGAAVKALSLATLGEVEIAPIVSWIDPNICAGCRTCIGLCPYTAITYNARTGVSVVNEALCKGCGSCAGFCPSGAAQVKHFNEKQMFAELEGIIDSVHAVGM
ncbi:MAG: FAD-dependent oxidoreductase, partial [Desulfobacterales bacterium]